jgi:hypothetical protein
MMACVVRDEMRRTITCHNIYLYVFLGMITVGMGLFVLIHRIIMPVSG